MFKNTIVLFIARTKANIKKAVLRNKCHAMTFTDLHFKHLLELCAVSFWQELDVVVHKCLGGCVGGHDDLRQ